MRNQEVGAAAAALLKSLKDHTRVEDFAPVRDRVLILPIKEEAGLTDSGLWVPEEEKYWRALVVSMGPGIRVAGGSRIPPDCAPGDVIVVGAYVGEPYEWDDVEFRMIRANDVMAVLDVPSSEE